MRKDGKLTKYRVDVKQDKIEIVVELKKDNDLVKNLLKCRDCDIIFRSKESITGEQRKKIWATINDIARFVGSTPKEIKNIMLGFYAEQGGNEDLSISDCTKEEARDFINILMDYVLENGIQIDEYGICRTEDNDHYLWKCCESRKCCISGQQGNIYRTDTLNDTKPTKMENKKICLSDKYYNELQAIGKTKFFKKYMVYGVEFDESVK